LRTTCDAAINNFYRQVKLSEEEYQLAQLAYAERLAIVCTGDLIKKNEIFILSKVSKFALYDNKQKQVKI
jgi:hypothetical protein